MKFLQRQSSYILRGQYRHWFEVFSTVIDIDIVDCGCRIQVRSDVDAISESGESLSKELFGERNDSSHKTPKSHGADKLKMRKWVLDEVFHNDVMYLVDRQTAKVTLLL